MRSWRRSEGNGGELRGWKNDNRFVRVMVQEESLRSFEGYPAMKRARVARGDGRLAKAADLLFASATSRGMRVAGFFLLLCGRAELLFFFA